jgi:hypothetical protein
MSSKKYSYDIEYVVDGKLKTAESPVRSLQKKWMEDQMKQKIKDLHWENRKNDFRIVEARVTENLPALEAMLRF